MTDTGNKRSWFTPYWPDPTIRFSIIVLGLTLLACVMSRAPTIKMDKPFGIPLPFEVNAVDVILLAPPLLAFATWFLSRSAANNEPQNWENADIQFVLWVLFPLLAVSVVFIWFQFFVILAPSGQCDDRPGLSLLWTTFENAPQAQHCMSGGRDLDGWYYVKEVWLQAWGNTVLSSVSLVLIFLARQRWKEKVTKSPVAGPGK